MAIGKLFHRSIIMKYSLFSFNFVFWLIGSCLVAIGGWSFLEEYDYEGLSELNKAFQLFLSVSVAVMGLGAMVFVISFAGCLGALRENTFLLKFYALALIVLFIGEISAVVFAFIFPNQFMVAMKEGLSKKAIVKYRDDVNLRNIVDAFQTEFQCCGISDEGFRDWSRNVYFNCSVHNQSPERCSVPYSCCRNTQSFETGLLNILCGYQMQNVSLVPNPADYIYSRGCIEAIQDYIENYMHVIASVFVCVSLVQLLAVGISRVLINRIKYLTTI